MNTINEILNEKYNLEPISPEYKEKIKSIMKRLCIQDSEIEKTLNYYNSNLEKYILKTLNSIFIRKRSLKIDKIMALTSNVKELSSEFGTNTQKLANYSLKTFKMKISDMDLNQLENVINHFAEKITGVTEDLDF